MRKCLCVFAKAKVDLGNHEVGLADEGVAICSGIEERKLLVHAKGLLAKHSLPVCILCLLLIFLSEL